MSAIWVPVIAALGASLLTAFAMIGVEEVRIFHAGRSELQQQRRDAYGQMLRASAAFVVVATTVRQVRKLSTGPAPVISRIPDPLSYLREFNKDVEPVWEAWSAIWLHGSQEAITAANRLVEAMTPVLEQVNVRGEARPKLLTLLLGERWSPEQEKAINQGLAAVGKARLAFTAVARQELGTEVVDLLAGTAAAASSGR